MMLRLIIKYNIYVRQLKIQKMTLGYMSGAKRAKNTPSITNNTCILGGPKKGGLVTMQGRNANLSSAITSRAPYCNCNMPLDCVAGLAYLKANNLMTMNPQCSGGVPHRMYRGCRSSSGPGSTPGGPVIIPLSDIATQGPTNTWTLKASTTIPNGTMLVVPSGNTLIIPTGLSITNNGTVMNNGTINIVASGSITNNVNSNLTNNGTISTNHDIINLGTLTNNATILIFTGGTLFNTSGASLINKGTITNNAGIILNDTNSAMFNNYSGATITITNSGYLTNFATITNNGTIQNIGGIIQNTGTIGPNPVV